MPIASRAMSTEAVSSTAMQVPPNSDLTLGMVCLDKSEPGRTIWAMTADERFTNPGGVLQGGFLAAFADSAMGAAAVTWVGDRKVIAANAELKISYLAPVRPGEELRCEAHVVSGGSRVAFVEASITSGHSTCRPGHLHLSLPRPGGTARSSGLSAGRAEPGATSRHNATT